MDHNTDPLPKNTLVDEFVIDNVLGSGGFSIVYNAHLATDKSQTFIIKEFMPQKMAMRVNKKEVASLTDQSPESFNKGRKLFFQEAHTLAMLKHPNIVHVITFFQENGTAYMVMKDEKGVNMQSYIRKHNGMLSERLLRKVFPELLSSVQVIHEHDFLHLDIKPSNIHLRHGGGSPLLLDFGAVRERMKTRLYDTRVVATSGFAPIEQLTERGYMGPWTDIYAIGATMRSCLDGSSPPNSRKRQEKDRLKPAAKAYKKRYSSLLLDAIDWAMEPDQRLRPQTCIELMDELAKIPEYIEHEPQSLLDKLHLSTLSNAMPWNKNKS